MPKIPGPPKELYDSYEEMQVAGLKRRHEGLQRHQSLLNSLYNEILNHCKNPDRQRVPFTEGLEKYIQVLPETSAFVAKTLSEQVEYCRELQHQNQMKILKDPFTIHTLNENAKEAAQRQVYQDAQAGTKNDAYIPKNPWLSHQEISANDNLKFCSNLSDDLKKVRDQDVLLSGQDINRLQSVGIDAMTLGFQNPEHAMIAVDQKREKLTEKKDILKDLKNTYEQAYKAAYEQAYEAAAKMGVDMPDSLASEMERAMSNPSSSGKKLGGVQDDSDKIPKEILDSSTPREAQPKQEDKSVKTSRFKEFVRGVKKFTEPEQKISRHRKPPLLPGEQPEQPPSQPGRARAGAIRGNDARSALRDEMAGDKNTPASKNESKYRK